MQILGISCFYHDSGAVLIRDGKIIAAAQEERFTRKRHDDAFPHHAVKYCLEEGGIDMSHIDLVAFYDKPFLKFERLLETYLAYAPKGISSFVKAMSIWLKEKLWIPQVIASELGYKGKIIFTEHHQAHAASAFFASPYQTAAVLTVDGVGEWTTTSWGIGNGNTIKFHEEIHFPHSLGLLYSAFTYYTGFKVNSGEYKVMGLAPYGEPKYVDLIYKHLIDVKEDGSFRLNMEYFNYPAGLKMTNARFNELFGGEPRKPESPLTQKEMDLAASLQVVTEEVMLKIASYIHKTTGAEYLCLAGGVALNCVANGRILREGPFKDIWVQPASGDAGGALGAALSAWYEYLGNPRTADNVHDAMQGAYLGPRYSNDEIREYLEKNNIPFTYVENGKLFDEVASYLADEAVIGWFQGRMEFGPRALGARSIIGDARSMNMQSIMNLKIKFRESFRPFAPSVMKEHADTYFDLRGHASPYMLLTAYVDKTKQRAMTKDEQALWGIEKLNVARSVIPAVTHVDYSARVQTVEKSVAPRYHALLDAFYRKTACPLLVNTSFNVRGEPIVCTPEDAYRCFMRTDMDYLVMENFIIDKRAQQSVHGDEDWKTQYELD